MNYDVNKYDVKLGEHLKELRLAENLTQKALAEKFNMNSVTYLHYEKSQREPSIRQLMMFADFFDVSVDYLIGYDKH